MERQWTKEQKCAIDARGCDLLVSAAAGSGKTSVLTERILSLLADPQGIDAARLAVVTFTKNAARELEDRLFDALSKKAGEDPRLTRQLFRLARAQISTIHAFCFSLIREYKKDLGLGERVRIADPAESALLKKGAVEEAVKAFLEEMPEEEKETRKALFSLFGSARQSGLADAVHALQKSAASWPGVFLPMWESLARCEEEVEALKAEKISLAMTSFGRAVGEELIAKTRQCAETLSSLAREVSAYPVVGEQYAPVFLARADGLKEALSLLEKGRFWDAMKEVFRLFEKNLPPIRKCPPEEEEMKTGCQKVHNDKVKKKLLLLYSDLLFQTPRETAEDMTRALALSRSLLTLAQSAEDRYTLAKRQAGVVDYQDLEQLTLSLLATYEDGAWHPTTLAKKVRGKLDAVFVDEYQDTNELQDLIFRLVSPPGGLFIVGDPKQSIYRFRGAEPRIFSSYKNRLPLWKEGQSGMQKILLSHNFRCDKSVVDLVNLIFRRMMDETAPGTLYGVEDRLILGKKTEEDPIPAQIDLVKKEAEDATAEDETEVEENREAAHIAARIGEMIKGGEKPDQIAVICRTKKQVFRVMEALDRRHIPSCTEEGENLKEDPEYLLVTSLLSALDNPMGDIALLGALSSPLFCFTPDDLYRVRKFTPKVPFYSALTRFEREGGHKKTRALCRSAMDLLGALRQEAAEKDLVSFLFSLYSQHVPDQTDSGVRQALLDAAGTAQKNGVLSLGEFCRYLDEAELCRKGSTPDGVRLMTIHKSKGLEFDTVFVSFLSQGFNTKDEVAPLLFSQEFGPQTLLPLLSGRARMNTLVRKVLRCRMHRDMIEEEKRVLYVALTRARRRLILTASPRSPESLRSDLMLFCQKAMPEEVRQGIISAAANPLTMILASLREETVLREALENGEGAKTEGLEVRFVSPGPMEILKQQSADHALTLDPEAVLASLSFVYDGKGLETLPKKLSVSQILKESREDEAPQFFPRRLLDFEAGILKSGPEKIGTATHQVMQFAHFPALEEDPDKEFDRLVEKGFLSPEDMALVEKDKVLGFIASPLYRQMKASPDVRREMRFNVLLDGESLGTHPGQILVQGVIDAWFENTDGTLTVLDFKTDRVKPGQEEVLIQRHGQQLRLYARAVEEICKKAVSRLLIYSFALGKEIEVK